MIILACLGLVDDSIDLDSFFRQYAVELQALNASFSPKGFPDSTLVIIDALLNWQKNTSKNVTIYGQNVRADFQDFLIDMQSKLTNFSTALRAGNLAVTAQRKDFVSAKNALSVDFKRVKDTYADSSLANFKSFQRILYLLGP